MLAFLFPMYCKLHKSWNSKLHQTNNHRTSYSIIFGEDALKRIVKRMNLQKKPLYFSMRDLLNQVFMRFYASSTGLVFQQDTDALRTAWNIVFWKILLSYVLTVFSLMNKTQANSWLDLPVRIICNTSCSQTVSWSRVFLMVISICCDWLI